MTCCEKMKELLANSLFLVGLLLCRMMLFVGMTSICIGISVMICQSYLYFNHVKLSTSFQTFITIGSLIIFSFCGTPCTSATARRRIREHPFMLFAIPHLIYIAIYLYSFMELFYLYMKVHSLPLGITNDAMYIIDEQRTTKTPRGYYNIQYHHTISENQMTLNAAIENNAVIEELIAEKNWSTAFFLLNFVYIVYVTCRVVLTDLEKNIPDEPSGSIRQLSAFIIMTITQLLILTVYLMFIAFASITWISFCEDPRQCLLITMTFSIIVGIIAAFIESGKPWPTKRDNTQAVDPFGWFENILRARFTVLVMLFASVNWSFFQDRKGLRLGLTEHSFLTFIVMVTASVLHITKMFSIIAIKRAEKIISAYRVIVAEDIEVVNQHARNNVNLDLDPENPPPPPVVAPHIPQNLIEPCVDILPGRDTILWETTAECSTTTDDSNSNDQNQNKQEAEAEASISINSVVNVDVDHNIITSEVIKLN